MPSLARAQSAALIIDNNFITHPSRSVSERNGLDDVAVSAIQLNARQQPGRHAGGLDAIPPLTRPLSRLRNDTPALITARPVSYSSNAYNAAVRLLATRGFEHGRLQRAIDILSPHGDISSSITQTEQPVATSSICAWLDDSSGAAKDDDDLSVAALQNRYSEIIVARAMDHLRLESSFVFRDSFRECMEDDLAASKLALVRALRSSADPSAAVPSPFPPEQDDMSQPLMSKKSNATEELVLSGCRTFSRGETGTLDHSRPLNQRDVTSLTNFPIWNGQSPSFASSPLQTATPNPRSVITTAPEISYLEVFRDVIFGDDSPSTVALRLLEHAREKADHQHFLTCLSILRQLSESAASQFQASEDSRAPASGKSCVTPFPMPSQDDFISVSRSALEDLFAFCIGTVPLDRAHRSPSAVRVGVHNYVESLSRAGALQNTGEFRENPKPAIYVDDQPFWPQFYFCLRCGSPAAALELCNIAHAEIDGEGSHFRYFLDEFITSTRQHKNGDGQNAIPLEGDDADIVFRAPGSLINVSTHDALVEEYNEFAYYSNDPYRRASYVLLARLELYSASSPNSSLHGVVRHSSSNSGFPGLSAQATQTTATGCTSLKLRDEDHGILFDSVENYFWLRLWLCRMKCEEDLVTNFSGSNFVNLSHIQDDVVTSGDSYFNPGGGSPLMFSFLLFITGMPWQAIEFLASRQCPRMSAYAAYLALPLHALRWCPSEKAFASILWSYTIHFATDFPSDAALCMFSLRDREVMLTCLERLILESGNYVAWLGDGHDEGGALEDIARQLHPVERTSSASDSRLSSSAQNESGENLVDVIVAFKRRVAAILANDLDRATLSGLLDVGTVTSQLYAISGDYEGYQQSALSNLSRLVSSSENLALRSEARAVAEKALGSAQTSMSDARRRSFEVLLLMFDFYDGYWGNDLEDSWRKLEAMNVLPLEKELVREFDASYRQSAKVFEDVVLDRLPDLMRAALDISERCICKSSSDRAVTGSGPRPSQVAVLITCAGLMGLSETEINARLVRLELLLA